MGILSVETGFDGKEAWIRDFNGTVRKAEASEEDGSILEALMSTGAYVLRHPPVMLWRKLVEFDDDPTTVELSIKLMGGAPQILVLDRESFRLKASSWDNGQMVTDNRFDDYRRVDGEWIPFETTMELGPSMQVTAHIVDYERLERRGPEAYRRPEEKRKSQELIFHGGSDSGKLAMHEKSSHILVEGVLNTQRRGWFLLDTGAGSGFLNERVVREMDLDTVGELEATGAAGSAPASLVRIESVHLGKVQLPAQTWVSLDLSGVEPFLGEEILGIIGYSALAKAVIEIDYDESWVRFHDKESFTAPTDTPSVPLRMDQNIPSANVRIEGIEAWVHLDTGSDNTLDLTAPFVNEHELLEGREDLIEGGVVGLGGRSQAMRGKIERLELGPYSFSDLYVNFNQSDSGIFGNTEVDGVLGAGVLSSFHLIYDYADRKLWLRPGKGYKGDSTEGG